MTGKSNWWDWDIEDPSQTVTLTADAKKNPDQGSWIERVEFKAGCLVCGFAYSDMQIELPAGPVTVTYGFGSTDLLKVQSWVFYHLSEAYHVHAWKYLLELRGE